MTAERSIIHVGGAPGSGKSRLARAVAKKLNEETRFKSEHVSLGDKIRAINAGVLPSDIKDEIVLHLLDPEYADHPLPDTVIRDVVTNALETCDERDVNVVLLDGFPRYLNQVESLGETNVLMGRRVIGGLVAQVDSDETSIVRMMKRGQKHRGREMTLEQARRKLELHNDSYPEVLVALRAKLGHESVRNIVTLGSYEDTERAGFAAAIDLLRRAD